MEKELYHINSNNANYLIYLRDKLNKMNIQNFIDTGGIHLYIDDMDVDYIKTITNNQIEKGMLLEVQNRINKFILSIITKS